MHIVINSIYAMQIVTAYYNLILDKFPARRESLFTQKLPDQSLYDCYFRIGPVEQADESE